VRIARVFPHRTNATPVDGLAFIGSPDLFSGLLDVDKVHIDAIWQDIRASDVGAPHRRERIWIIAYPHDWNANCINIEEKSELCGWQASNSGRVCSDVAHPQGGKPRKPPQWEGREGIGGGSEKEFMAYPECTGVYKPGFPENADGNGREPRGIFGNELQGREEESGILADPQEQQRPVERQKTFVPGRGGPVMADTGESTFPEFGNNGTQLPNAGNNGTVKWERELRSDQQTVRRGENIGGREAINAFREWWAVEPDVGRVANGIPFRVDRLKGIGNSVVPQIPEMMWLMIKDFL
jgi:site-specific DNA-cytosine methylase